MGLMIKLCCTLLVIGFAGLFVLKKPDGTPWLSLDDFIPNSTEIISDTTTLLNNAKNLSGMADSATENSDTPKNSSGIYRWKDKNGQWQFSDTPPENQEAESITVTGHLNSDLAEKVVPTTSVSTETSATSDSGKTLLPTTISPDKVKKLIEDANNVQQLMDDRQSQIDQYTQ